MAKLFSLIMVFAFFGLPPKIAEVPNVQPADQPPGFPAHDEFADSDTACDVLVDRMIEREDLREPIREWCHHRVWASSRGGKVRSRLDGSWIHDRDRPAAFAFYRTGLKAGYIDPALCSHHIVDTKRKRTRKEREFIDRWPYGTHCDYSQGECRPGNPGHMRADKAKQWHKHPPDYERFGTRGPTDHNFYTATKYLGGCFSPDALDRHDVSTAITIKRAEHLCLRLEDRIDTRRERKAMKAYGLPTRCKHARDIREIWHPRFWYDTLRYVFAERA